MVDDKEVEEGTRLLLWGAEAVFRNRCRGALPEFNSIKAESPKSPWPLLRLILRLHDEKKISRMNVENVFNIAESRSHDENPNGTAVTEYIRRLWLLFEPSVSDEADETDEEAGHDGGA